MSHFGINKTYELVIKKYYWLTFRQDDEAYIKDCDIYLASKIVKHKPFSDF